MPIPPPPPLLVKLSLKNLHSLMFVFAQVSRIARHRQVPKHVKSAQAELKLIKESKARKEANRRKHSKPGAVPNLSEREAHTVEEKE